MAFKMNGWGGWNKPPMQPGQEQMGFQKKAAYKKSALKQEEEGPAYGGSGKKWSEYDEESKGDLNVITKNQKAYEQKKKDQDDAWNKKDDNIWKSRQNKINELVGSEVRHEITEKTKTKDSKTENPITGNVNIKKVEKTDVVDPETGEKVNVKTGDKKKYDAEGNLISSKEKSKNIDEEGNIEKGREKLKIKHGDDEEVIGVRGYATGEKKDEDFKAKKKRLKEEAKANKKKIREEKKKKKEEEKRKKKESKKSDPFA